MVKTKFKPGDRVKLLKDVGFEPELGIGVGSEGVIAGPYVLFEPEEGISIDGYKALFEGYDYPFGVYTHEIELITEDEESID